MKRYGLVGAGGYGREVAPLVRRMIDSGRLDSGAEFCFVVEGDPAEDMVNGIPVVSLDAFVAREGEKHFNIAIGNSLVRERIASNLLALGCAPFSILAENTVIMDSNTIGEGAILSPFVTITSNAKIGRYFHANLYAYVAHDCVIGDFVTFAPSVKCNGNVHIEDHAYIGTGAVMKQGTPEKPLVIGRGAVIGMGAVVTRDVAPGTIVVGNPARPMERGS